MGYTSGMLAYLCRDQVIRFELRKIALNTSGYTARGEYYGNGNGMPLYRAIAEVQVDGEWNDIYMEFRAVDREDAKATVLTKYPKARFAR